MIAALLAAAVIGHSVEHRPITVTRVGDPHAARKVLVVGEVHGNEPAGSGIVQALKHATPPPGSELLLVKDLNPDGFAHHTRTNAHGVDLNRNSPEHWAGAGPKPWSEPETRAIRALTSPSRRAATPSTRAATRTSPACPSGASAAAPAACRAGRTSA